MATNLSDKAHEGSFLLELLHFAGWELQVQDGKTRAMRSGRSRGEG
jgi:hypothetical protein